MNTSRWLPLLAAAASLAGPAPAASAQADTPQIPGQPAPAAQPAPTSLTDAPSAEEVFAAYVAAIGGEEAVHAHRFRKLTGTYRGAPFANGARITMWQEAPDKAHLKLAEPLGVHYDMYYDGETAWDRDNDDVSHELGGSDRVEMMETADFYGEANYAQRYAEMTVIGEAVVENDAAWVVRVRSHEGRSRTLMFSKASHLFVAEESTVGGEGGMKVQVVLDQYKDADGLLFPMRQRQQIVGSDRKVEIVYREVSHEPFEHDFSPPAELIPAPEPTEAPADEADTGG